MKKIIAILLTLVIACSFMGCSSEEKWYCLGKHHPDSYETYYVNIDFEDLEMGTYDVLYYYQDNRALSDQEKVRPGILFVHEDRYDLVSSGAKTGGYTGATVYVVVTVYK